MNKALSILALAIVLLSCTPDKTKEEETVVDCNCDRIITQATFNVIGTPSNATGTVLVKGTTVNDCTKLNKDYEYSISKAAESQIQKIGTCRTK